MFKKSLSVLLCVAMLLSTISLSICNVAVAVGEATVLNSGECGAAGDNVTWTLYSDGELVISGSGDMKDYNYGASPWYSKRSSIKPLTIESGVTSIGDNAFPNCDSLTSINIPDGVTSIGDSAFYSCKSLTTISFPDSVTDIDFSAFAYCTSLTSINLPDGVTSIGNRAFLYCTSLTSIVIPNSVISIKNDAFTDCANLTIYGHAGSYAKEYANEHRIPFASLDVTVIASGECGDNLTWTLDSDGELVIEGTGEMWNYNADSSFTFYGDSIKSVIIKTGVISIGDEAFSGCTALTTISIPVSVTSIADNAFEGCENVKIYGYYDSYTEEYANENAIPFVGIVASGECGDNLTWTLDSDGELVIEGMGKMWDYSLNSPFDAYAGSIKSVTIKDGVTSIGDCAFYFCTALNSISIPGSVTSIGNYAFVFCISLTSIIIPDRATSIGTRVFTGCTALTSIIIPRSVNSIENYTFNGCDNVTIYGYPGSYADQYASGHGIPFAALVVTVIDSGECGDNLTWTLYNHGGLVIEGTGEMWNYNTNSPFTSYGDFIRSINIKDGITSIGNYAFVFCTSLTTITISDGVTSIGERAFTGCTSLKTITIPDSITYIDNYAFNGCNYIMICGHYYDSYAGEYARGHGIPYAYVEEPTTEKPTTAAPTTVVTPTTAAPTTVVTPTTAAPTTVITPTTAEPTTVIAPTTAEPTTVVAATSAESTTEMPTTSPITTATANTGLKAAGDKENRVAVDEDNKKVRINSKEMALEEFYALFETKNLSVRDKDSNDIDPDKGIIGTGSTVIMLDSNGSAIGDPYTIVVMGDVTGDGLVKPIDARAALRAAVSIAPLTGAFLDAARISGNEKIKPTDARKILRVAVNIDAEF